MPTTTEYIDAANYAYRRDTTLPPGLSPFLVNGQPLTYLDNVNGFFGTALQTSSGQVVVAFEGTDLKGFEDNPQFTIAQVAADAQIYFGQTPIAFGDALNFTNTVISYAGSNQVYLAGHSLGAGEVQYVGAKLGLTGATFGGPGISSSEIPTGSVSKLTNYVEYGDPVGNYSSNPNVEGYFLHSDQIVRFGDPTYVGNPLDVLQLQVAGQLFKPGSSDLEKITGAALLADGFATHHSLVYYAQDLKVPLSGTPGDSGIGVTANEVQSLVLNVLQGKAIIAGGAGDDVLSGSAADDVIRGGAGNDQLSGLGGNDVILGNKGDDIAYGNTGNDLILGNQGNDLAYGGQGDDSVFGGQGADTIAGNMGNDVLVGNKDNDVLYGNMGNDVIYGGQGNDLLFSGQGADTLYGNLGIDTLSGNSGSDTFVFKTGDSPLATASATNVDTITDFVSGSDKIKFIDGPSASAANFGTASMTSADFGSIRATAQTIINGGKAYAFVTDGANGYLFATENPTGTTIEDVVKLAGASSTSSLQAQDILTGS